MATSRTASTLSIVTPYLASANNGNWRTAARWRDLLAPDYRVIVQAAADAPDPAADIMIALHARRSRPAIARWRHERRDAPLVVVLTGTDLYRDVPANDRDALASLADADRLIVLQEDARRMVPPRWRDKSDVVFQSAPAMPAWPRKGRARLACVFVAHLRPEKDPATVLAAWRSLPREVPAALAIVGEALDEVLGDAVRAAAGRDERIQWLGGRSHRWTRQAIRRAHVLVCASRLEGGANVVVEAVTAGTAVVASRISGNVGMLGADYGGYFEPGDAAGLGAVLRRCREDAMFLGALEAQCAARAYLFSPAAERQVLGDVIARASAGVADRGRRAAGHLNERPDGQESP